MRYMAGTMRPTALIPLLALTLTGCARERVVERPGRTASAPAPRPSATILKCYGQLNAAAVRFTPLPDREPAPGCPIAGTVRLDDIGTPVTNLGALTCPLAAAFAGWTRYAVQPAARIAFGQPVERVESMGTYACRPVAGSSRLSEHARANAVDVGGVVLADGRRVTVREGWSGQPDEQRFWRLVRQSACRRFGTVLSPDYNADHHDHLHLDMAPGHFCR